MADTSNKKEKKAKEMSEMKEPAESWHRPSIPTQKPILVNNTLAGGIVPLIPMEENTLLWYTCGPTVYDSAHLGHARNYVTADIMRRIIEDYFGFRVFFAMNITDIDDKIILRARRNYLFNEYKKENTKITGNLIKIVEAHLLKAQNKFDDKIAQLETEIASASEKDAKETLTKKKELEEEKKAELEKLVRENLQKANEFLSQKERKEEEEKNIVHNLLESARDPLSDWLDEERGASFKDNDAIRTHAARFEDEFLEDMQALGVRPADALTRVSEHVKDVIEYVEKIIKNGYGYVTPSGSVYFDTHRFRGVDDHSYLKLAPNMFELSKKTQKLLAEGEGALSTGASEKKNPQDFALWKASKPGEPVWESPWGLGRPGWHIECSAMASKVLGKKIDIHSGGIDLKFPHHDNEIAQAEAYYDHDQWVNYWLHTGHLDINGLKMSKSLKNFITIREAFEGKGNCPAFTPRQLRIMFLYSGWDRKMDFQYDSLHQVKVTEKSITEFFLAANNVVSKDSAVASLGKAQFWRQEEHELQEKFMETQHQVDKYLRENLNFQKAFLSVLDLVSKTNSYFKNEERRALLVRKIGSFVHRILSVFGLTNLSEGYSFSFASGQSGEAQRKEEILPPYLDTICNFRARVRELAIQKAPPSDLLKECDLLRDQMMPPLGVQIMDDGVYPYSLMDPAILMKEIEEKKEAARKQAAEKTKKKITALLKDIELWEKKKLEPQSFFTAADYSKFDDSGKPTHNLKGEELNKQQKKKIEKEWNTKAKAHTQYLKKIEENPNFLDQMKDNVAALQKQLNED